MNSSILAALGVLAIHVAAMAAPHSSTKASAATYTKTVEPFLARHCFACHNAKLKTGDLDLESLRDAGAAFQNPELWEKVLAKLHAGLMPPPPLPRPKAEELEPVDRWIQALLSQSDRQPRDPGRVTAHRLNRFEYNNTIDDLLGLDFRPADDFLADDSGYGFDNIGDVLSLSPVLMEKYLAAAQQIARLAIAVDPPVKPTLARYRADRLDQIGRVFHTRHRFPVDAEYELRTGIAGRRPRYMTEHLKVAVSIDGREVKLFEADVPYDKPRVFNVRVPVKAGDREVKVDVVDDGLGAPLSEHQDRALSTQVDYLEVRGPFAKQSPEAPESYQRIFICGHPKGGHTEACLRPILRNLARRAWRRPVTGEEIDRLAGFVKMAEKDGDSFEHGMRLALAAILVSPNFLFRIERDPNPNSVAPHPLSDIELASRLSYFLWSSMPDEELLRAAGQHRLRKPGVLEAQVRRMLRDPKSGRLVENFADQWLELRNLASIKPDPDRFPDFDEDLREAMHRETVLFFRSIVREDRGIQDFIDGKYTFLNERLARHYGIPGVTGSEFRRVELNGAERSGVLTQASILTVTSYANRTSPVLRGKFLLENILGSPPPPPPPDAGVLDEDQVNTKGTVRQQFEAHRSHPQCAPCHARMDPLGFAFENYDGIGAWRTHEGKFPVDASGKLPDGRAFTGAAGLKAILETEQDEFAQCLAGKMLTYALGRGLEAYDKAAVREITRKMGENQYRFSSMILAIVESAPFEMRRGEAGKEGGT